MRRLPRPEDPKNSRTQGRSRLPRVNAKRKTTCQREDCVTPAESRTQNAKYKRRDQRHDRRPTTEKRLKTCSDNDTYRARIPYGRYATREGHVSFSNLSTRAKATTASKQLNNQQENNDIDETSQQSAVSSQQSAVSSQQVSSQQSAVSGQQSAVSSQQSAVNKSAFSSQQSAVSSQQAANSDSVKHETQAHGRHYEPEDTGAKREGTAQYTTQAQATSTKRTKHVDPTPLPNVALRAAPRAMPGHYNSNHT
jgi:hypothetical protein